VGLVSESSPGHLVPPARSSLISAPAVTVCSVAVFREVHSSTSHSAFGHLCARSRDLARDNDGLGEGVCEMEEPLRLSWYILRIVVSLQWGL